PGGDRDVYGRPRPGHRDLLAAPPGHGPDVAVGDALPPARLLQGGVQAGDAVRDGEVQFPCGGVEPPEVLGGLERPAVVRADALEDSAAVVQAVGEDGQAGVAPRHERPVQPDHAVAVVERNGGHSGPPWSVPSVLSVLAVLVVLPVLAVASVPWPSSVSSVNSMRMDRSRNRWNSSASAMSACRDSTKAG